ncbi:MAG: carboxypeptidase regulatory-like domain-containing protein [Vicinamibacterales bacterium]
MAFLAASALVAPLAQAQAPAQQAQLRVIVVDQTGGGIPAAVIRVMPANAAAVDATTDERGVATLQGLATGAVQLHVEFPGFDPVDTSVTLRRGANNQTITLRVAGLQEEIVVADAGTDDRRGNSLTTTLEEDAIAELSDDPEELAAQLEALTGGAGAVFQVDGFRGGRLPARDQIRQIRFRTNSFSADNHDAGRVQVEIITRPGLTQWNGNANLGLRSDVMNARNAFAQEETPEQFRRFNAGLRGPLVRNRTSLRFNVDGNRSFDTNTIYAELLPGDYLRDVIRRPIEATNVTVGLDHGLTRNSTLRFEFRNSENVNRNQGVGEFSLPERAFTRTRDEQQVRTSVQTLLGRNLNEFRVQWDNSRSVSDALTQATSIVVLDAFSAGGAGVANQTHNRTWEISDDFDFNVRRHAMRVGMRLEGGQYSQQDARNQFGTFTFSSLDAYLAGTPTTFTQRLGQVATEFGQYQLGLYWQDDFRISRNLSLSVGLRNEMQSHIDDAFNPMPRFGYTWNPFGWRTTLRGGYGIFYDWYDADLHDQTQRVNGVDQVDILILNPGYPDPGSDGTFLSGGRVVAAPDLRMPYVHQASIGIERPITQTLTLQASVAMQRGYNQMRSRNINAPNELGIRPQPEVGTITQIESTGRSNLDRATLGLNYRIPRYNVFMFTNYTLTSAKNHADNALTLPANSLDPDAEWGPSFQDVRHRFNAMVNVPLALGVRANLNVQASSAQPFNITTGRDDNADGVTNDRPAGVGRNSGRGAARVEMNLRVTRGFGFGDRAGGQQNQQGGGPVAAGPGGPGGPGGQNNERFRVEFYAQAFNLLNRTNYQSFSGNMLSSRFLQPTSAGQARRVEVGMQFRF